MKIKIKLTTPKGEAPITEKRLRKWILGKTKATNTYVNKEGSELFWEIETSVKRVFEINKNVLRYESLIKSMFENKLMKKTLRKKLSEDDQKELEDMLLNQTSVEVIKEATAQEIVESNVTLWERIKKRFRKI